ncbi:MAG: D-alanyl-D-alanine carboxypeptidase family protein [Beijerinckiaceae bacterium]
MTFSGLKPAAAALVLAVSGWAAQAAPSIVVDANSGQVISAVEATRPWYPASTTKMMTAYVALKAVRDGRIGLETAIPVSRAAAGQRPSKLGVRPGQEITLENALKVMMVKSANDLAVVVAEGVGGSVPQFAAMMNAEARALGMRESHFVNPHGFHAAGHTTSARDLAILARALYTQFPEHRSLYGIGAVQVGNRIMKNTNGLIGRYPGAMGLKTGFVCASGFNLVGLAQRGGRTLIAVTLGAGSGAERSIRTAQALDSGFSSWSSTGQLLHNLPSTGGGAPDMRGEICRGRRGVILADDVDTDGPIAMAEQSYRMSDSFNPALEMVMQQQRTPNSVATRTATGGMSLGPRAEFVPELIALGRTSGSASAPLAANAGGSRPATTAIAARSKPVIVPVQATAFAPAASSPPPALRAVSAGAAAGIGKPLSLQGEQAEAAEDDDKPAARAAIRAPARQKKVAARTDAAKTEAKTRTVQADKTKPAAGKPAAKVAASKPVNAKPVNTKAVAAKPVAKPKSVAQGED